MDLVSEIYGISNQGEDGTHVDEDGWMIVPGGAVGKTSPLPNSSEFELIPKEAVGSSTKTKRSKRKRSKKDIAKSYIIVHKDEVTPQPCEEWHSCDKCFSDLINDIPYIDEGGEEPFENLPSLPPGEATGGSPQMLDPLEIQELACSPRDKRCKVKRSTAMYQIHGSEDDDKENRVNCGTDLGSSCGTDLGANCGTDQDTYCGTDQDTYRGTDQDTYCGTHLDTYDTTSNEDERERKLRHTMERSDSKYDHWDSYPKKSNNHRKSNPFPRQRIKESKFWGTFGDWRSVKKRFHYS